MNPVKEIDNIIVRMELEEKLSELLGKYAETVPVLSTMRSHRTVVKSVMKHLETLNVIRPIEKPTKL